MKSDGSLKRLRNKKNNFTLRARLIWFIGGVVILSIIIAFAVARVLESTLNVSSHIPLLLQIIIIGTIVAVIMTNFFLKPFLIQLRNCTRA